ncbi:MAG: hypothetical protein ACLU07_04640 [Lachnospirales bacterium]|jgi:hypothetical protein
MKKNYRKLILVLAIIALCVSAISISDVYAKYVASANGAVDISIARWDIKLNTLAIKNGTDISAELTPVFDTNANLAANKLAPGATGYFDLALDYTNVDVGFDYNIKINNTDDAIGSTTSNLADFKVTGYSIDGGTTTTLNSGTTNTKPTVITGTIPYAGTGTKTKTIRVFIKWVDDTASGATMTDAQDSEFTWDETNRQIKLKIDATFEQKV